MEVGMINLGGVPGTGPRARAARGWRAGDLLGLEDRRHVASAPVRDVERHQVQMVGRRTDGAGGDRNPRVMRAALHQRDAVALQWSGTLKILAWSSSSDASTMACIPSVSAASWDCGISRKRITAT